MTRVALLWHMHQPFYEDLVTREHVLPWVRLHALKDYYGMVAILDEFPDLRLTFNLVPSLLVQLEAFAAGRAHDRSLDLSLKPADTLTDTDRAFIVDEFFHAQRRQMIEVHPRYRELLSLRESGPNGAGHAARKRFTVDDLRDLQVWHKLAWIDPLFLDADPRVRGLVRKGRAFTEADKATLGTVELELLNAVIPAYKEASARGQVELSTSPFYHPILPLLCDTDVYRRTHPESRMPRHRFQHPEDAAAQLARAVAYHERLFGSRPVGLWPSEGSVSDAMVPLVADAGFEWMATDEMILARSLGVVFQRDPEGHVDRPEQLYAPYVVEAGGARVACGFRDHALSDLIGFAYAGWAADLAADDFVRRLEQAGRRYAERTAGEEATIFVILDGENAWEHFEGGGRPFLRALYSRLSRHPELRTVTMGEACRGARAGLRGIFPGSWIDANFYIWIGHADDQRAWSQLAEAHDAVESARVDPPVLDRAREELLIAEGSDWFWWYGDDHSSDHDLTFDDLFRRHLRNVYRLLDRPVPDELFVTNITSTGSATAAVHEPTALLDPTLDGEVTSYFEWLGAGCFEVRKTAGAMHQIDRRTPIIDLVQFAFGEGQLFVRIDGREPMIALLAAGYECVLTFLAPAGVRFSLGQRQGRLAGSFWDRHPTKPGWVERGPGSSRIGLGAIVELALPLSDLADPIARALSFFVAVHDASGVELERHPAHRPIDAVVPDARFAARHWTV